MKIFWEMILRGAMICGISLACLGMVSIPPTGAVQGMKNPEAFSLFKTMVSRFVEIHDYRCLLVKKEWIANRWNVEKMNLWFRKPMDIKLSWLDPHTGQQAIYRQGFNDNRIRARRSGLFSLFPVDIDPHGKLAMENNRYPITHAGIGKILEETSKDIDLGQCDIQVLGEAMEENRSCVRIRFRSLGPAGFHHSNLLDFWMDGELKLPIRIQVHDHETGLVGDYLFSKLEVNLGLTDKDFKL